MGSGQSSGPSCGPSLGLGSDVDGRVREVWNTIEIPHEYWHCYQDDSCP
jgi:hypothetical protein